MKLGTYRVALIMTTNKMSFWKKIALSREPALLATTYGNWQYQPIQESQEDNYKTLLCRIPYFTEVQGC